MPFLPFVVKGPKIVTLPSKGGRDNFGKVPKSPPPTGYQTEHIPGILTRAPIGAKRRRFWERKG